MEYYVYVLKSEQFDRTYTGMTADLNRRLKEHNTGKTKSTRPYKPWRLVYHELVEGALEARKREKYLKSAAGRQFIKSVLESE